jgi:hypothetical protein
MVVFVDNEKTTKSAEFYDENQWAYNVAFNANSAELRIHFVRGGLFT